VWDNIKTYLKEMSLGGEFIGLGSVRWELGRVLISHYIDPEAGKDANVVFWFMTLNILVDGHRHL
jgi:hypothetical protein